MTTTQYTCMTLQEKNRNDKNGALMNLKYANYINGN